MERFRRSPGASSVMVASSASPAECTTRTEKFFGGPRRIAPSNASRTIWYSAACERSPNASAAAASTSTWMPCSMPRSCASAFTAMTKPWSRSTTGSRLNERSRSSPIVSRVRDIAFSSTASACSVLPRRMKSSAASSINATPASDCTGPSCRKSAMRRRSSCSAARTCSVSSCRDESSAIGRSSVDDRVAQCDRDRVRPRVGLELGEDVAHVALHGLLRDEELGGYVGIRHSVGEQLEDLALAPREHVVLVLAREERRHERGVDVALTAGDLLDRAQQRGVRSLLEDVTLRARLEAAAQQASLAVCREDEDCRLGDLLGEDLCRLEPVHPRHPDVHDHDVRTAPFDEGDRALTVARLADHPDVRSPRQGKSKAFADDLVVVDDQAGDLGGAHGSPILWPSAGNEVIRSVRPPIAAVQGHPAARAGHCGDRGFRAAWPAHAPSRERAPCPWPRDTHAVRSAPRTPAGARASRVPRLRGSAPSCPGAGRGHSPRFPLRLPRAQRERRLPSTPACR